MQVATACPHCFSRFQVAQAVIGKRTRCTKCGERFVLAESQAAPVVTEKPPAKPPTVKADSFNFDGSTQSRFDTAQTPPVPPSPPEIRIETSGLAAIDTEIRDRWQRSPATVSREYWALRIIARTLELLAIILDVLLVISIAIMIYGYLEDSPRTTQDLTRVLFEIFELGLGVGLANLILFFIANIIRLGIQIERNTFAGQELLQGLSSQTAELLQTQHTSHKDTLSKKPAEIP